MAVRGLIAAIFAPERRAWRGQQRLAVVFWGHGVLVSAVLGVVHARTAALDRIGLQQLSLMLMAAYTGWVLVSIWRCAGNATPFWGLVARWLTIAWAGNAAMVLLFLQLDLAAAFLER